METIFDRDFYPTPEDVIAKMLQGHNVDGKVVLEPSAGSGNIVDYLLKNYAKDVVACEINGKLRSIVESKCEVIADDFLTVTSEMVSHIDMIVMNPPFSDARRHILHAYEVAPDGCEIISLCNSSDISGGYYATTDQQRLRELVEQEGYSENFGSVFCDAERRTRVNIECLHIFKPKNGEHEFEDYLFSTVDEQDHGEVEGLIEYNLVRDVVNRYCEALKMFDKVEAMSNDINSLTEIFRGQFDYGYKFGCYDDRHNNRRITRSQYKKGLQKQGWKYIIDKMDMERFATSKVYEQINEFVERQQHIPFTMKNVYQMIYMIIATQGNRMETALVDAFEHICSFSAENSTAGEKWKTNANYMVNKKFIVPHIFTYDHYGTKEPYLYIGFNAYGRDKLNDVCKALEYISGKKELMSMFDCIDNNRLEWGKWHNYGGFFRFKGFKKGTMHVEFLDDDLWMLFNRRVAEIKGWALPKKTEKGTKKK